MKISNFFLHPKECMKDIVYWIADSWKEIQPTTLNKSWLKFLPKVVISTENFNNDDGENVVLKDLVKEVPGCENCNADDVKKWLNAMNEMLEITESTIVEIIEDEKECNDTERNDSLPFEK